LEVAQGAFNEAKAKVDERSSLARKLMRESNEAKVNITSSTFPLE
jgi:hypothetical protein